MSNATIQSTDSVNNKPITLEIDKLPFVHQRIFLRAMLHVLKQPSQKPLPKS